MDAQLQPGVQLINCQIDPPAQKPAHTRHEDSIIKANHRKQDQYDK
jgi:hypothetical protein